MVWYNTELNIASNLITFVEELLLLLANGSGSDMLALNNSASKSKWVNKFQVTVQEQCSVNFGGQYNLLLMKRAFIK